MISDDDLSALFEAVEAVQEDWRGRYAEFERTYFDALKKVWAPLEAALRDGDEA